MGEHKVKNIKLVARMQLIAVIGALTIVSAINMIYPLIIKELVDSSVKVNILKVKKYIILMLLVTIFLLSMELIHKISRAAYIKTVIFSIQQKVIAGIMKMNMPKFNEMNESQYVSMFNNDINMVITNYYDENINLYQSIISVFFGAAALLKLNYILALIVIITSCLPLIIPMLFRKKLIDKKEKVSKTLQQLNITLKDSLIGFELIKSYNIEKKISRMVNSSSLKADEATYEYTVVESIVEMIAGTLAYISYVLLIVIGILLIVYGKTTAGSILAAIQISDLLATPVLSISNQLNSINSVKSIKKSIEDISNMKVEMEKNRFKIDCVDNIQIKNLSFAYEESLVLKNINLKFERGKKYAIVGLSGSGKSTLLKIINKTYSSYEGKIEINENDLKGIDDNSFHKAISMLHQQTFIFNDSLLNNITLFKNYDELKIKEVIAKSNLEQFMNDKDGYELECFNDGNHLSGGEKQRIALARALINHSNVLLLDEATSALDNINYKDIETTLLNLKDVMIINITHKLDPIFLKKYDEIIVLNSGEVLEKGDFEELLKNKGLFYNMIKAYV